MKKSKILFVDDEPYVLRAYERSLHSQRDVWEMHFESCPLQAWARLQQEQFDTVVSDVRMPGITGLELLQRIKHDSKLHDLPVVIVTGEADKKLKSEALNLNASDLLNKPVQVDDLTARLRSVLRIKSYADQLRSEKALLEERVQQRTAELNASRVDILWRLGKAAEYRDEETGNHVVRVGSYSRVIAKTLGQDEIFCDTIFLAAPLHDIGKIGVPDAVLLKPGKLDDEEWVAMRAHCEIGVSILTDSCHLKRFASQLASPGLAEMILNDCSNPVIDMAAQIAQSHHEKYDGSGYPDGIAGDNIPLVGRIVAIADVYDALRSRRPYKEPFSIERSVSILKEGSGSHFDPQVVEAFLESFPEIQGIEKKFADAVEPAAPVVFDFAPSMPMVPVS
ncbi:MAG: HD domain-containing phosphohydrolase [Pirellulaceae bacterium]